MFKRNTSIFILLMFIFTILPFTYFEKVHAYTSNSYFNNLKVGLTSMSATSIKITLNGDYTLNGQTYPSGSVLNLAINGTSIIFNSTSLTEITLVPNSQSNLLTIASGTVTNKYMGSFLMKVNNAKILPINTIDMENYLKGVVGYEMSDYFPIEALKSQAVAARNYALSRIGYEIAKGYDFDDTINYQVYKGYNASYTRVITAVDETKGQVLLYNDRLVETLYSAWHGGVSENSENVWGNAVPYLRSALDTFENDPWPSGNRILTNAQIQSTLITKGYLTATDTFVNLDLNSITKFTSGRVSNINIIYKNSLGSLLTKSVIRDNTRTFLSLPSNLYTVTYDSINGAYTFSGKGYGHGLGMSQIGAKNRATAGQTYDQILKFYYQNTYLQNLILKASLSTLTQNTNALFLGDTLLLNSTATGGNGYGYLFKYVIKNGANIIFTKDYSSNSALDFLPNSAGSYTIEAYVKDKFSTADYDDKKESSLTVYESPILNTFNLSKTDLLVGQTVVANVDVQTGSGSYLYKYELTKDNTILVSKDFSTIKEFTFTPDVSGTYAITTYVKDSISTKSYDFKESRSFNVFDPLTFTSFTKDQENISNGDTVNLSTTIVGGSNKGINYKFQVIKDGQVISTRDFNTDNKFTFVANSAGNYEISVYAVDILSENEYDAFNKMNFLVKENVSISALTTDKNNAFTNEPITFNATTNSSNALYKFVISKDSVKIFTRDYFTDSSLQYVPTLSGNYEVNVFVKDSLSQTNYDDVKSLSFTVLSNAKISSFEANKAQYITGDSINLNVAATSGSGSYLYKYIISTNGVILSTIDYNSSASLQYVANTAGTYSITVYLKDMLSNNEFDSQNTLSVTVYNPQLSTITASGSFYEGKPLTLNASSTGSSILGFTYKYEVYKNSTIVAANNFSNFSTFSFTSTVPGIYTVKVYGKDGLSSNAYDSTKQFSITINSKPLYLSKLPLKYGMKNNDVASLQSVLIKLGYSISDKSGYFGTQTKNQVISFQKSKALTADGIVGTLTYNALNEALIQKSGIKTLTY